MQKALRNVMVLICGVKRFEGIRLQDLNKEGGTMSEVLIEAISYIMEIIIFATCLSAMKRQKLKVDLPLVLLVLYTVSALMGINEFGLSKGFILTNYIAIILYCVYQYKEKLAIAFIKLILISMYIIILQLIIYIPAFFLIGNVYTNDILIGCIVNVLCFLLIFLFKDRMGFYEIGKYIEEKNFLSYLTIGFIVCFLFYHIGKFKVNHYIGFYEFVEILTGSILILVMWFHLQKNRKEKKEKEQQLQVQAEYVKNFEKELDAVKYKQHDIKHHISAFEGMWKEQSNKADSYSEQKEYYEYMKDDSQYQSLISGGNPIITGFLYEKIRQMKEKDISFRYKVAYEDISVVLSIYQWIEVMGILLDNAMDASVKQKSRNGEIYMELLQTAETICLKVMNESPYMTNNEITAFFKKGYSTKGENRGIGLSKLKGLIIAADGDVSVRNLENEGKNYLEFAVTFFL